MSHALPLVVEKRMRKVVFAAALMSVTSIAIAATENGGDLFRRCDLAVGIMEGKEPADRNEAFEVGMCLGLVQGVVATMVLEDDANPKTHKICTPPGGIKIDQATKAVMGYLFAHPEKALDDQTSVVHQVIKQTYPCK
jgi:hypothetical protein